MFWKYKNKFLIFLSLCFGLIVVLFSAKMAGFFDSEGSAENATSEWESALSVLPGVRTLTRVEKGREEEEKAFVATTTTDIVARRLLTEYLKSHQLTDPSALSDEEANKIALRGMSELKPSYKKVYELTDLNISKDNSYDANLLYMTTLNRTLKDFVATGQKETELTILFTAVNEKNPSLLDKLGPKIVIYQELIKKLLALKTPSNIAPLHLQLLQSYETLRGATGGLHNVLGDPAAGLAAIAEYKAGLDDLFLAEQALRTFKFVN